MATTKTAAAKMPSSASASAPKSTTTKKSPKNAEMDGVSEEMKNSQLHELFIDSLQDIYWAEKNLGKALPKLKKGSTSDKLSAAIEKHIEETETHAQRLEQIFEMLGEKAKAKKCEAMAGLIEEANTIMKDTDQDTMVRDAGIIMAAQKVEHYEIATYGSLKTLANRMGHSEVASLLEQTLENEKQTDAILTEIAETYVNEQATAE